MEERINAAIIRLTNDAREDMIQLYEQKIEKLRGEIDFLEEEIADLTKEIINNRTKINE